MVMGSSQIRFRAWDKKENDWFDEDGGDLYIELNGNINFGWNGEIMDDYTDRIILMQYTGKKDINDVERYEHSELDGAYEVIFKNLRYSLRHIHDNDIIDLYDYWRDKNGEIEVTREYTKV